MGTTKKDIESALMRGADSLRDTIDAANYKDYVLPLMFVKYLSDTYREKVEELDRTKQDSKHRSHRKRRKAEIVEFQQSSLELGHVAGLHMRDLPHLLGHIRMDNARHQLHKQHNADNTEEIRNAVADRDRVLILRGNSLLRRGERRRGGQRAGQEARHDGGELLGIIARCTALDQPPYENAEHCRKAAGEDDDKAQQNIGFEVLLHELNPFVCHRRKPTTFRWWEEQTFLS